MSPESTPCRICTDQAHIIPADIEGEHRRCPRCGDYKISGTAIGMIGGRPEIDESRITLSAWVRNQNNRGNTPTITSDIFSRIASRPIPSVAERADLLLLEIVRSQPSLHESVEIGYKNFTSASYSQHFEDVVALARMLCQQGLARMSSATTRFIQVTFEGHRRADELVKRPLHSATAFVAMRFADELDAAYERGISIALMKAGYEPVRVDRTEHVNRIDDEIIARIRASALVIADFTEHSPGVYFEAGFALGLNLPVIWTCHKDHMDDLHFDIRQYNCIDWETPEELAARLQPRIEAIAGKGPKAALDDS